jgi:hypothetical protein
MNSGMENLEPSQPTLPPKPSFGLHGSKVIFGTNCHFAHWAALVTYVVMEFVKCFTEFEILFWATDLRH